MFGKRTSSDPVAVAEDDSRLAQILDAPDGDEAVEAQPLWAPSKEKARNSVERLLLERGHITEEQLAQAKALQAQTPGKTLAQILLTMNAASEGQILHALAETM